MSSLIGNLGEKVSTLVDLSNSVNKTVLTGFSSVLQNISKSLDLRAELDLDTREDLVELTHRINVIKTADMNSKKYLGQLRELLYLDKGDNLSLIGELKDASLDLLDISTDLNRYIIDSLSKLLDNVADSPSLANIVSDSNPNLLNDLVDKVEIVKNLDVSAQNLVNETGDMLTSLPFLNNL